MGAAPLRAVMAAALSWGLKGWIFLGEMEKPPGSEALIGGL
jgi:hypothetical protein